MCIRPLRIRNKKYLPSRKNNYNPPVPTDERLRYIEVPCGKCYECRKRKANAWSIRLIEEIKVKSFGEGNQELIPHFMTLTFSDDSINTLKEKYNLQDENEIAGKAIRLFTERYRKRFKHGLKHWLISEVGEKKGRIHLHGIIWTALNNDEIKNMWSYGWADCGKYVSEKSMSYFTGYVNKFNKDHPDFQSKIWASKGLGKEYLTDVIMQQKAYNGEKTQYYYTTSTGHKVAMPDYYKKKIYSDEERELLYLQFLDKPTIFIDGVEVDKNDFKKIEMLRRQKQLLAKKLGLDIFTGRKRRSKRKPVKEVEYIHGQRIFNNNLGEDKRIIFDWEQLEANFLNININQ